MSEEQAARIPDAILERYRLGELPPAETDRLERQLRTDEALRERLDALERSDREIAGRYPADWLAQRIRQRIEAQRRADRRWFSSGRPWVVATALAAVVLGVAAILPWRLSAPSDEGDRIKGLSPALVVYRRTPGGSETLADGAPARAGDLLRLGYVAAGRAYGLILSIDGRGIVTPHLPPEGTRAAALRGGGTILLDQAYELDDAPAVERFYFVTAEREFDAAAILDAARRAAARDPKSPPQALPLPRGLGQFTFSIQKEVKP